MTAADRRLTRYLLGDLTEAEREALEREYFSDPGLFSELVAEESDLLDGYVRGTLPPETKLQLERHRLSDPWGRERLEVARALASKADAVVRSTPDARPAPMYWPALIAASVAAAIAGSWLLLETGRLRRDLEAARSETASARLHAADLEQQLAGERSRRAFSPVAALLLNLRGTRSATADAVPTLAVSASTALIHLDVSLGRADYRRYRLTLQSNDGTPIVRRDHVAPESVAGDARLTLDVARSSLSDAEYVLTVSGETAATAVDDIGKTMFRVRDN